MLAAVRLSRSLRSTSFIASTRISFSNLSPLGITASSSRILIQDPIPNPVPSVATVPPSSFFLTHRPFEFQIGFSSLRFFSHRGEKTPNGSVNEDKNSEADDTCCRMRFTRKVYELLGSQLLVTAACCSVVLCSSGLRGLLAESPSFALTAMMTAFFSLLAQVAYMDQFPLNFMALGLQNLSISLLAGFVCAIADVGTVLASAALTAAMASSLSASASWAARNGYDFQYLGVIHLASGIIFLPAMVLRPPPGSTLYFIGFANGGIFWSSSFILSNLHLKGHDQDDDYAIRSSMMYMELLNLFLIILKVLHYK